MVGQGGESPPGEPAGARNAHERSCPSIRNKNPSKTRLFRYQGVVPRCVRSKLFRVFNRPARPKAATPFLCVAAVQNLADFRGASTAAPASWTAEMERSAITALPSASRVLSAQVAIPGHTRSGQDLMAEKHQTFSSFPTSGAATLRESNHVTITLSTTGVEAHRTGDRPAGCSAIDSGGNESNIRFHGFNQPVEKHPRPRLARRILLGEPDGRLGRG